MLQQVVGQLCGLHTQLLAVDEDVERALGLQTGDAVDGVDGVHRVVPAALVLLYHVVHFVLLIPQSHHGGGLSEGDGAGGVMLVEFVQDGDVLLRRRHIAQTPAGHGVGLGHAVHGEGVLLHAGEGGNADVLGSVIDQPLIYLVGDDHQIVAQDDVGQPLQGLLRQHAAGGVVGGDDHNGPGLGGDLGLDLLQVQLIAVFLPQFVSDRDGVEHTGHVDVVQPHRVGDQNLVSLVQNGGQYGEHGLGQAGGYQNLGGLIVDAVLPLELLGDLLPQFHGAIVGGIEDVALVQAVDGGLLDVGGGVEIRAADFEVEYLFPLALHGQCFFVDLADTGGGHPVHSCCDFHRKIHTPLTCWGFVI